MLATRIVGGISGGSLFPVLAAALVYASWMPLVVYGALVLTAQAQYSSSCHCYRSRQQMSGIEELEGGKKCSCCLRFLGYFRWPAGSWVANQEFKPTPSAWLDSRP